jgi:genome maintenance exonuclease 1
MADFAALKPKVFDHGYFVPFEDQRSNYVLPTPQQVNDSATGRYYLTPDGKRYPSMSNVLSILNRASLEAWRKRVGRTEAAAVSRKASGRGTAVHTLAEHYIKGNGTEFTASFRRTMPDGQANWPGVKDHLDAHLSAYRALECKLFSRILRIAGTADLIGTYDGKLSIIDFKTSGKIKKREYIDNYFMQTDGYGLMWQELTEETPEQCVIIMATDGLKEPQIFIEPWGQSLKQLKQARVAYFKETQT